MPALSKAEVDKIIENNRTDQFHLLADTPGFVLDPMPLKKARELSAINTVESLGKLGRHPKDIRTYRLFRQQVLSEWSSMPDYMQHKVFDWPHDTNADGLKHVVPPATNATAPHIVWRPNDFPYYMEAGVHHDNIWSTVPLSTEHLLKIIEDKLGTGAEYAYFVNPGPLASIPGVWHAHCMYSSLQS